MGQIVFITGTDTGAGKTVLTALLLAHLRRRGVAALAMKPFCSGSRRDVRLLSAVQNHELPLEIVNPYFFSEAAAPLVALRKRNRVIPKQEVIDRIRDVGTNCDRLLVEGSGGLLVPLSEDYTVADVITGLGCPVILVGRNRLGIINHTLLTVEALRQRKVPIAAVVLTGSERDTVATRTNVRLISELVAPLSVFEVPYLAGNLSAARAINRKETKIQKLLAGILKKATFAPAFGTVGRRTRVRDKNG